MCFWCVWCVLVCFRVLGCFGVFWCVLMGVVMVVGGALLFWCGILGFGIWSFVLSNVIFVWFWFPMF